ncbi:MAG TPA: hypothetical protein VFW96_22460 [Thermomicrobiales bacterium]|nr:hypothetical protein [Thermomicrobiales bacterium]
MAATLVWLLDGEPVDLAASATRLQELLDAAAGDAEVTVTIALATGPYSARSPARGPTPAGALPYRTWPGRLAAIWRGRRWVVPRRAATD